jgi:hypothetical protein
LKFVAEVFSALNLHASPENWARQAMKTWPLEATMEKSPKRK